MIVAMEVSGIEKQRWLSDLAQQTRVKHEQLRGMSAEAVALNKAAVTTMLECADLLAQARDKLTRVELRDWIECSVASMTAQQAATYLRARDKYGQKFLSGEVGNKETNQLYLSADLTPPNLSAQPKQAAQNPVPEWMAILERLRGIVCKMTPVERVRVSTILAARVAESCPSCSAAGYRSEMELALSHIRNARNIAESLGHSQVVGRFAKAQDVVQKATQAISEENTA